MKTPTIQVTVLCEGYEQAQEVVGRLAGESSAKVSTSTVETKTAETTETKTAENEHIGKTDSIGMPYDPEIHTDTGTTNADGTWKARRGKAAEAKQAAADFKASGGDVEVPTSTTEEQPVEEVKADENVATLPGASVIPDTPPVDFVTVMGKIGEMFNTKKITAEQLGDLYQEVADTKVAGEVTEKFKTDETARSRMYARLIEIENGEAG